MRDDKQNIKDPNLWGLFGGSIKKNEKPIKALTREVEEEINIKVNVNGSEHTSKSFETIFRNGEEIGTMYSDGQGNDILIKGASNLQEEDLQQILKEQIEEAKNNGQ